MIRYKTDKISKDIVIILKNTEDLEDFNAEMLKDNYKKELVQRVYKSDLWARRSLKGDEVLVWLKSTQKQ
jgi:hypothetical protein